MQKYERGDSELKVGGLRNGVQKMGLDEVGKLVNEVQKGGLEKWRGAAGGQRLGVQTASRVEGQK